MAITAYVGLPRSGKSYSAVLFVLLAALKAGRTVVTNLPLKMDAITRTFPTARVIQVDLNDFHPDNPERVKFMDFVPGGAQCIFDELWELWPSGMKTVNVDQDHKTFLAKHGHLTGEDGRECDIAFVTQELGQIAAFARNLVAKTYVSEKLDAIGATKRFRVDMYRGRFTGYRGPKDQLIRTSVLKYDESVFAYYKSHTHGDESGDGFGEETDQRAVIWKSPMVKAGFLLVFVGVPFALFKTFTILSTGTASEEVIAMADPTPAPTLEPMPQYGQIVEKLPDSPIPTRPPSLSERLAAGGYRLVGYALRQDGSGLALLANGIGNQYVYVEGCETIENSPDLACEFGGAVATYSSGGRWGQARTYQVR